MTPKWYVPRRTILRGMGTGIALPFLEAMVLPRKARALDPRANPRRFVGIWGLPCGAVGKDDPVQGCMVPPWTPAQEGPLLQPDETGFLDPFFGKGTPLGSGMKGMTFRDVSKKLSILTGVSDASCDHMFNAAMLSSRKLACPTLGLVEDDVGNYCRNTRVADVGGPTANQIAAQYFFDNQYTAVHSMVLGADPRKGETLREIYGEYLSWKNGNEPATKDLDPGKVFDKLFTGTINPKESAAAAALRKKNRISILDFVNTEAKRMNARLGKQDQNKVGQYLQGIRDIEVQIARGDVALACVPPARPEADNKSWLADLDLRIKVMIDLMVKAFECDRTRVGTVMFNSYNGTNAWPFIGLYGDHHGMSHYTTLQAAPVEEAKAYMNKFVKWSLQMMAYFMGELDKSTDPDGSTLLDDTVMLMSGDYGDSDVHCWASTCILLGGRGGRDPMTGNWAVRAGRHVRVSPKWNFCWGAYLNQYCHVPNPTEDSHLWYPLTEAPRFPGERSTKDLLWGMLKAIGIPDSVITRGGPTFGYATAPLDLTFPDKA